MDSRDSDSLSRRKFIYIVTSFPFLSSFFPPNYLFSSWAVEKKTPLSPQKLLKVKLKFFTPYQATVIEDVTALIIPSDNTPGAKEAGVVFKIDNIVSEKKPLQELYTRGIEWFDFKAKNLFDKDRFVDLSQDEKIEIINVADKGKSSYIISDIPIVDKDNLAGVLFFYNLVRLTLYTFYSSDMGWKVVGYNGPPQWKGNLDYHKCGFK